MLTELKNLHEIGGLKEVQYFLNLFIINPRITKSDLFTICLLSPNELNMQVNQLIAFFSVINIVTYDEKTEIIEINKNIIEMITEFDKIVYIINRDTIKILIENNIFDNTIFRFNPIMKRYEFINEKLPIGFYAIRNLLINLNFIERIKEYEITKFYINSKYENLLTNEYEAKSRSLDMLEKELLHKKMIGEKAEQFVLDFERNRVPNFRNDIKQISIIDTSAGFDILSFENNVDNCLNRYIEVKAIGADTKFYISRNELDIGKMLSMKYCIYLVDINKCLEVGYEPRIIIDPINQIINSNDWIVEPSNFLISEIII